MAVCLQIEEREELSKPAGYKEYNSERIIVNLAWKYTGNGNTL